MYKTCGRQLKVNRVQYGIYSENTFSTLLLCTGRQQTTAVEYVSE